MKRKKNGFIAISILYSFFLCFVALMMGLLASYANSTLILRKINTPIVYNNKEFEPYLADLIRNDYEKEHKKVLEQASYVPTIDTEIDNDGTTYYYKGNVTNNYVGFAGKSWRILRINGDESIRIILQDVINERSAYNNPMVNEKYVGYTYDHDSRICTYSSPCTSDTGTSSDIKRNLDQWYNDTLKEKYDKYITTSIFCNDTNHSEVRQPDSYYLYDTTTRVKNNESTFSCPDAKLNYGGVYKLKIGLISADELNLTGAKWQNASESNSFLNINKPYFTMSPFQSFVSSSPAQMLSALSSGTIDYNDLSYEESNIRPVINLNANVQVLKGDGSSSNPYLIDTN